MTKVRHYVLLAILLVLVLAPFFFWPDVFIGLEEISSHAHRFWTTPYFYLGDQPATLGFLFKVILFLLTLALLTHFFRRFLRRAILARTALDEGLRFAIEKVASYFIFVIGLLVGLQTTGLNLTSLAFLGGAIGIILGFGLQNISSNFVSGLILIVERPVRVGDRIEVGNLNGDVIRIGFIVLFVVSIGVLISFIP